MVKAMFSSSKNPSVRLPWTPWPATWNALKPRAPIASRASTTRAGGGGGDDGDDPGVDGGLYIARPPSTSMVRPLK